MFFFIYHIFITSFLAFFVNYYDFKNCERASEANKRTSLKTLIITFFQLCNDNIFVLISLKDNKSKSQQLLYLKVLVNIISLASRKGGEQNINEYPVRVRHDFICNPYF